MSVRSSRALVSRLLAVLGALTLVVGVLATYLREEVVDEQAFVSHATEALRSDEVRDLIAEQVVVRLVDEGGTDLIAARPLVRPLVDALVGTEAFADLVAFAARDTHRLLFTRDDDVSFAIADAGTLAIAAIRAAAPDIAEDLPTTIDVDVVALRDEDLLAALARAGESARTLALVLPPIGLLLLLGSVAVARDRRGALVRGGLAVAVSAGVAVAALVVWRSRIASGAATPGELADEDVRAAATAAWEAYFGALRGWLIATGVAGVLVAALAAGRVTATSAGERLRAGLGRLSTPAGPGGRAVRGLALAAVGALLLAQPEGVLVVLALLLGGTAVYIGVGELTTLLPKGLTRDLATEARPRRTERSGRLRRLAESPWLTAAGVLLVATAGAGAVVGASTGSDPGRSSLEPGQGDVVTAEGCNGSVELCDRRLDEIVWAGTHNSFSAAFEPGWLFANQRVGIPAQLRAGIRFLMLDPHHGIRRGDVVVTDLEADGSDRNRIAAQLSPQAVRAAERLGGRLGEGDDAGGRRGVYLCHTLCELGAEPFVPTLRAIRDFLRERPGDVVILALEPSISPELVATSFRRAGILDALAVLDRDEPLPTLGDLVRRGDRIVVLAERGGGEYDWYHPMYDIVADTPLGTDEPGEFSCRPNRGSDESPLLMLNHWIDQFPPPLSENREASQAPALRSRVARCERERERRVNVIATDFFDVGDVVQVVRELNRRPPVGERPTDG